MDSSSPDAIVRQNLLDRLLNSVKQVQVHFGARQEIATESDARVSALCVEWEMVLAHAAKKPKPKNSLRLTGRTTGVSLWPLAKLCISTEDLQRFHKLSNVTSELGRGRAWLRAAINERTLENYMHNILGQDDSLRKLYEPHAFLLDQERSSMLPVMAAGLSSIIFSIGIDASYLNTPTRSVEVPAVEVPVTQASTVQSVSASIPPVMEPTLSEYLTTSSSSPPLLHNKDMSAPDEDEMIAISAKVKKKKSKKSSKSKSPRTVLEDSLIANTAVASNTDVSPAQLEVMDRPVPLKESASSSSSRLSLDSMIEDGHAPLYVALTTPRDLVSGEAMAAANATALVLSASSTGPGPQLSEQPSPSETSPEHENLQQPRVDTSGRLSPDSEMRGAMLALSRMKDELELQNKELSERLSEQQRLLEASREEIEATRDAHSSQKLALERENDLLREQLKKYVSMVQAQRREVSSESSSIVSVGSVGVANVGVASVTPEHSPTPPPSAEVVTQDSPATAGAAVDKKLHDMAEMYADLMELNERLHRNLADKDNTICALVRSLREASIEVPLPQHQLPAAATEPRVLVEVWIPSVIKKGRGPEAFHVYQVFVSVKGVEWNVYRRYTEFREFHRQLQKHVQEVSAFSFPPKKAIGNKSSQVVEERRQRLQEYLRFVIKCCSSKTSKSSETIIPPSISKQTLVTIFPFFKEDFNQDPNPAPLPPLYSGL